MNKMVPKEEKKTPVIEETVIKQNRYFPTIVYRADLAGSDKLNASLLKSIYKEKEKDSEGIQRSNFKALGGWHSQNFLHKQKAYSALVKEIAKVTDQMNEDLGYDRNRHLRIGTMWSIVNPPGCANRAHVHPGCNWSGVYYVHAPEKSGDIQFNDPRTEALMNQLQHVPGKKRPSACWNRVNMKPEAGKMIIFPSWLYHAVDINQSELEGRDGERVIISFNLSQVKR